MASATPDDFLSGQGVAVDLHDVEAELTRLWGPAAEQVGGPDQEHPNVTRIVLANLVVDCRWRRGTAAAATCSTPSPRGTPAARSSCAGPTSPAATSRAEVSALCHLPAPGLPQVCSERIVLRAGPDAVDLLPGRRSAAPRGRPAVRPLVDRRPPAPTRPSSATSATSARRLILDLPDPVRSRGAAARPRPHDLPVRPRHRLVRPRPAGASWSPSSSTPRASSARSTASTP